MRCLSAGSGVAKELQKHVLELIPASPGSLSFLEENLYQGLCELYRATNYEYGFMGLGMHPLLTSGSDDLLGS